MILYGPMSRVNFRGAAAGPDATTAAPQATHGRAALPSRLFALRQVAIRQDLA
jgi:hypothetical protein